MQTTSPLRERAGGVMLPELDLRELPAPEPMLRALQAADALRQGQSVAVLTPLVPTPLLDTLAARGLEMQVFALPSGGARVLIHHPRVDECGASHCSCIDS